jgi:hypothetical protein
MNFNTFKPLFPPCLESIQKMANERKFKIGLSGYDVMTEVLRSRTVESFLFQRRPTVSLL